MWRERFQDQGKDWAGVMFWAGQTGQDSHALRMVKDLKPQSGWLEQKWRGGLGREVESIWAAEVDEGLLNKEK